MATTIRTHAIVISTISTIFLVVVNHELWNLWRGRQTSFFLSLVDLSHCLIPTDMAIIFPYLNHLDIRKTKCRSRSWGSTMDWSCYWRKIPSRFLWRCTQRWYYLMQVCFIFFSFISFNKIKKLIDWLTNFNQVRLERFVHRAEVLNYVKMFQLFVSFCSLSSVHIFIR